MTAKEYLNQAYIIDRRINMTLAKSQKLRESLYGRGQKIDDVGGGKGGDGDVIGETISKVMEYEEKASELIDKLVTARLEIEKAIQSIPDEIQREVLERRYLLFQNWESYYDTKTGEYIKGIADDMGYSPSHVYRIHGSALNSIKMIVNESE